MFRFNAAMVKAVMELTFDAVKRLREAGHKEYAHDESTPFRNFEQQGQDIGVSREKVWYSMASKHWDGIKAHINGTKLQREPVTKRVDDLIMYLVLFKSMHMENEGIAPMKAESVPNSMELDMFLSKEQDHSLEDVPPVDLTD